MPNCLHHPTDIVYWQLSADGSASPSTTEICWTEWLRGLAFLSCSTWDLVSLEQERGLTKMVFMFPSAWCKRVREQQGMYTLQRRMFASGQFKFTMLFHSPVKVLCPLPVIPRHSFPSGWSLDCTECVMNNIWTIFHEELLLELP